MAHTLLQQLNLPHKTPVQLVKQVNLIILHLPGIAYGSQGRQ